jgi:hypothetical protein
MYFGGSIAGMQCPEVRVVTRGLFMNFSRWFLSLILLGLSSSVAMADSVDPQGKLQGGGGSTELTTPDDPNFQFTVFGGTSPQEFDFINSIGQVAVGVNLVVTLLPGTATLTFTCDPFSEYFTNCSPQSPTTLAPGGTLLISFFTPNTGEGGLGGIPNDPNPTCSEGVFSCSSSVPGADFGVVFQNRPGTTDLQDLPSTQGFSVKGSLVVPEPSAILLVLTGGVLLFFFKRSLGISDLRLGS